MLDTFAEPGAPSAALSVKWRWEPCLNKAKSKEEGRPIYEDKEWVTIRVPGDPTMAIDHFATDEEKAQHRRSLEAWKADHTSEGIVGTRLEQWPMMSRSTVEELKHFGVRTVEQLAAMNDANVRNIPRGLALRSQAQAWVKAAKDAAPVQKMQAEIDKMRAEFEAMKAQRDQAMQELDKATEPKGKR